MIGFLMNSLIVAKRRCCFAANMWKGYNFDVVNQINKFFISSNTLLLIFLNLSSTTFPFLNKSPVIYSSNLQLSDKFQAKCGFRNYGLLQRYLNSKHEFLSLRGNS